MMKKFPLFFTAFLGLCLLSTLACAEEISLWNKSQPTGQWRAFGAGMLQASPVGIGLSLDTDWAATTFGIGAVFEGGGANPAFPSLADLHTLTVEARSSTADGTMLAPEWVVADNKALRVAPAQQVTLTDEWQTFTFRIPDDFPGFGAKSDQTTALRLLFVNPAKPGRAKVSFRDVRLSP
ncbi:hypothetical protein BH09VER1_BH09VER1_28110 [soil metagenome]